MKIKVFLLFILSFISVSCMRKELTFVSEEDFLNNKIYMNIIDKKEVKLKVSYTVYVFLSSGDESVAEIQDPEYIEVNARYNKTDNETIICNEKIKLSVIFFNEHPLKASEQIY